MSGLNLGSFAPTQITLDADAAGRGWYPRRHARSTTPSSATCSPPRGCRPTRPARRPGTTTCSPPSCTRWATRSASADCYRRGRPRRPDVRLALLGERRLPGAGEADGAVAGSITSEEFLGAPIDIGVLPAGKQVTIQWQATIDPQTNQLIVNPVNTGTVSATNAVGFPDQNTNTVTTTLDTLILGGTIWNDNGAGGGIAGNGIKDGTEPGVSGVTLSLFVDANNDNVPDSPGYAARHRRPDQRQRRLLVHRACARQLHRARRPGQFRRRRQHLAGRHAVSPVTVARAAGPGHDDRRRQRRQRLARRPASRPSARRSRSPTTPSRRPAPATTPTPRSTSASSTTRRQTCL